MAGSIFIIQDDDTLVEMTQQPYEKEDHLQRFLERYPAGLTRWRSGRHARSKAVASHRTRDAHPRS